MTPSTLDKAREKFLRHPTPINARRFFAHALNAWERKQIGDLALHCVLDDIIDLCTKEQ